MDFIIFEQDSFWSTYFLETMFALSLVFLSIYLFVSRKGKKGNGFFGISILIFSIFLSALLVLPKTLDVKNIITSDYVLYTGVLNDSSVKTSGNPQEGRSETRITVDDKIFYLKGNHSVFEDVLDNNVTVYYLPNSKHVFKVEVFIPMKEE